MEKKDLCQIELLEIELFDTLTGGTNEWCLIELLIVWIVELCANEWVVFVFGTV